MPAQAVELVVAEVPAVGAGHRRIQQHDAPGRPGRAPGRSTRAQFGPQRSGHVMDAEQGSAPVAYGFTPAGRAGAGTRMANRHDRSPVASSASGFRPSSPTAAARPAGWLLYPAQHRRMRFVELVHVGQLHQYGGRVGANGDGGIGQDGSRANGVFTIPKFPAQAERAKPAA